MITIQFKIDEDVLKEDLEEDINKYDEDIFFISMFIMPVRMQVNGIDLFELNNEPWDEAPLMNIASSGLTCVKKLKIMDEITYIVFEGPGIFTFTKIDDFKVKLDFSTGSKRFVMEVNYDELLEAFQKFADNVRRFLRKRVPQLYEHPYWGPWLRGEKD